jgi:hypothetical protein
MRRLSLAAFFLMIPFMLQLTTGCGGGKKTTGGGGGGGASTDGKGGGSDEEGETAKTALMSDGTGTLKGKVTFVGDLPAGFMEDIPDLVKKAECHDSPKDQKVNFSWSISKDKGVQYVVVWLQPGENKYFKLDDAQKKPKEMTFKLEQPHCAFMPHVFALYPSYFDGKEQVKTGQKLDIVNNAAFAHNTEFGGSRKNPSFNKQFPPKHVETVTLVPEDKPIRFKCDIHSWMRAYAWAFDHPFFAVTDKEGNYEITGVPAGVDIYVTAWHEDLPNEGFCLPEFKGSREGQKIQVEKGKTKTLDFQVKTSK